MYLPQMLRVHCWKKPVLLKDQAIKWNGPEEAIQKWNDQVSTLKMCRTFRDLQGLDGEPIDFEWKIFPGAKALDILHKNSADLQRKHITPENFSDRKIFMTMFNDIFRKGKQ